MFEDRQFRSLVIGFLLMSLLVAGGIWGILKYAPRPADLERMKRGSPAPVKHEAPHAEETPHAVQPPPKRASQPPQHREETQASPGPKPAWPVKPHQDNAPHQAPETSH